MAKREPSAKVSPVSTQPLHRQVLCGASVQQHTSAEHHVASSWTTRDLEEVCPRTCSMPGSPMSGLSLMPTNRPPSYCLNSFTTLWMTRDSQRLRETTLTEISECSPVSCCLTDAAKSPATPASSHFQSSWLHLATGPQCFWSRECAWCGACLPHFKLSHTQFMISHQ